MEDAWEPAERVACPEAFRYRRTARDFIGHPLTSQAASSAAGHAGAGDELPPRCRSSKVSKLAQTRDRDVTASAIASAAEGGGCGPTLGGDRAQVAAIRARAATTAAASSAREEERNELREVRRARRRCAVVEADGGGELALLLLVQPRAVDLL